MQDMCPRLFAAVPLRVEINKAGAKSRGMVKWPMASTRVVKAAYNEQELHKVTRQDWQDFVVNWPEKTV
jgi:hypothetical protein